MSTFARRQTDGLLAAVVPPHFVGIENDASSNKHELQSLFLSLSPPISSTSLVVREALAYLEDLQRRTIQHGGAFQLDATGSQAEEEEMRMAASVVCRVTVALYAEMLEDHLYQAGTAQVEAEWWDDVARSRLSVLYYLIQTLPLRIQNVFLEIVSALRSRNLPVRPSAFTLSSIRQLFPTRNTFSPGPLISAFYPHLKTQPHALALSVPTITIKSASLSGAQTLATSWLTLIQTAATAPLALTRQECTLKRDALLGVRDERAKVLGELLSKQVLLDRYVKAASSGDAQAYVGLTSFSKDLQTLVDPQGRITQGNNDLIGHLSCLATYSMVAQRNSHSSHIQAHRLLRPSALTRAWPRLLIIPPLALYAIKQAYGSQEALAELASNALDTADRFWHDWILEPLRGVIKTIRAGSEEGMIINAKGVAADIDSLERMSMALAKDKLSYTSDQLAALSSQIREGDLTPVLRIYEDDIRSPLRSAISGTLLRSVFIQVQKAKVDLDQALSGIDKLLKSQELTFAFVGVAPAFAIVWMLSGALRRLWVGGSKRGRYGGRSARTTALASMRRIERLLVSSPLDNSGEAGALPPLTAGLLVLSLAHVRRYAERMLPVGSRIRDGMLEDIADLEDTTLGRSAKIRVVDRMWRCWAGPLGWGVMGGE